MNGRSATWALWLMLSIIAYAIVATLVLPVLDAARLP